MGLVRYVLDIFIVYVAWQVLDLIRASASSLPVQLGFIPQLDAFSVIVLTLSAILVFGRYLNIRQPSQSAIAEMNKKLEMQYPMIFMELAGPFDAKTLTKYDPIYPENRGRYLWYADIMKQHAYLESMTMGTTGSPAQKATEKAILSLVAPIVKSRRQYPLSLREKVSDLLGFFP